MKFNIKPEDAHFHVDERNKTVVCVINNTRTLFKNFVENNFRIDYNCPINIRDCVRFDEQLDMPNRFVGIAKCGETDVWNEDVGRAVAFSRAKDNLCRSFFKRARTYVNTIDKWLEESVTIINQLGAKFEDNMMHRHQYVEELISNNERK